MLIVDAHGIPTSAFDAEIELKRTADVNGLTSKALDVGCEREAVGATGNEGDVEVEPGNLVFHAFECFEPVVPAIVVAGNGLNGLDRLETFERWKNEVGVFSEKFSTVGFILLADEVGKRVDYE